MTKPRFLLSVSASARYNDLMESIIRNVKDIEAEDRRSLEHVVGQQLRDNQEVVIRVIDLELVPEEQARREALARAADIARQGRANVAASGASSEEVDVDIEAAIREVRRQEHPPQP